MLGRSATDGLGFTRSAGVFSQKDAERLRNRGSELAFDPLQQGWVLLDCEDDLAPVLDGSLLSNEPEAIPGLSWRDWRLDDAPHLQAALSDADLWTYLPEAFGGAVSDAQARALIEVSNTTDLHDVKAVTRDGKPIGQVRLQFNSRPDGAAELSYWFAKTVWGQGVGSHILPRYLERVASAFPEVKTLTARVHIGNVPSQKLLQKMGFVPVSSEQAWQFLDRPNQV